MICLQRVSTNCKQIFDAFMDTFARKAFGGGGGWAALCCPSMLIGGLPNL